MTDKITIKNSWESITLNEFQQLVQISGADIPEHYRMTHLISILTGWDIDEIEKLPIRIFTQLKDALDFMNTEPDSIKHKNEYEVNGHKYIVKAEVDKILTAQFLDYTTYSTENPQSLIKLASCFLVPEGHTYGDGYDVKQVWNDIGDMSFLDVKALAFFLQLQYATYILISTDSIDRQMKKMGIKKKERHKSLIRLHNMARSLLSLSSSRHQD